MSLAFSSQSDDAIPIRVVSPDGLDDLIATLSAAQAAWIEAHEFGARRGEILTFSDTNGAVELALIGLGPDKSAGRERFVIGGASARLPAGTYQLTGIEDTDILEEAALGWLLQSYRFDRYKAGKPATAHLITPKGIDTARIEIIAKGEALTRDLINTPANDMGPEDLEAAAKALAKTHGAEIKVITGDALLKHNFPLIHTVGRAADRAPRLIDMNWGKSGPKLVLVGKGVCFDTGGLNLKPGASMGLMKKDMGGAAAVLGLAHMIMALGLDMQLRVLIPAVENSVSSNAFRPSDILMSRKGLSVEINNTDAEGRLVLADALALADEGAPDLIISMATLTGAARVAVGPDLAPFFTDNESTASILSMAGNQVKDPLWRMPFHDPYEAMIEPGIADLDNAPRGGFGGTITAALFLRRFVEATPYIHFDIYGWQPSAANARPKGGVGQGTRALLAALPDILGL